MQVTSSGQVTCLKERGSRDVFWDRRGYSDFTNKEHIQRLKNRALVTKLDEAIPEPPASGTRRLSLDPVDWKKFIFCQNDLKTVTLNQVQTFETSDKILKNAKFDKELIAAEGKYHLKCYARFLRNTQKIPQEDQEKDKAEVRCFEEVITLLQQRLSEGHIYSLKAVWTYYSNRLERKYQLQSGIYRSNRFKERIQEFLGDTATFVAPFLGSVPALQAAGSHGPRLSAALGSVQFQSSCTYFVCACFLSSACAVRRAVFVVICTRSHYPVYACAIHSVIRYCPVHCCVCSCAICPVSGTYYS